MQISFYDFLEKIYSDDKENNPMPFMKATKLLEDIKRLLEKYSTKE